MKKGFIAVLFLVVLVIFAAGCKKQATSAGPFVGGIAGVSIKFIEGAPLSSFNQGQQMNFKVVLKNNGEYTVATGGAKARIYGVNPEFGLPTTYLAAAGPLHGISKFVNEGGEQEILLGSGKYSKQIINSQDFPINAQVCYPYQTEAVSDVCMSSRTLQETKQQQVCDITGEKLLKGSVSAAPVQITSITEGLEGSDKVVFKIVVDNKGTGDVFSDGKTCETLDPLEDKNLVTVTIMPADVKCYFAGNEASSGQLRLTPGTPKILTCRKTIQATGSNYKEVLDIKLNYKYLDKITKTVTVYQS